MSCDDLRLDEYLDGELDAAAGAAVELHLKDCGACRGELERSRRLEALLKPGAAAEAPDTGRFLSALQRRTRPARGLWMRSAAAAALLLAGAALYFRPEAVPPKVAHLVAEYAKTPSGEIERQIGAGGAPAFASLERIVVEPESDERSRFAAAALLFKLADAPTRDRVLAAFRRREEVRPAEVWRLPEPGAEDDDVELVPVAISLALEGQERRAIEVLHKLHRLNRQAQGRITEAVVALLHSARPQIQKLALEIVKELDLEFPLTSLVDLLDSPELGTEALRFLKVQTGKDFGRDQAAWRKALGQ